MQTQLTLFHHPLCPHSRFARFVLREYGLPVRQIGERVWERREEFLVLNPAGTTPVLVVEGRPPVPGASIIAEYLDELYGRSLGDGRLLPLDFDARIEVRRLMHWFNDKFFEEVSGPVMAERYKRHMPLDAGGGSADYARLDAARQNIGYHIAYLDLLLGGRVWIAGAQLSYADLAAAAHLSTTDYLGALPWTESGAAKAWYARLQSRPAFQSVLADGWRGFVHP
jgi:glutathione S-transferase